MGDTPLGCYDYYSTYGTKTQNLQRKDWFQKFSDTAIIVLD